MKTSIALPPLLLAALLVRADITIEQKVESPGINEIAVTKIKGDLMRVEQTPPAGQALTITIRDLGKHKVTSWTVGKKTAVQWNLPNPAAAKAGEEERKPTLPKPAGQHEKVGDWTTDLYELPLPVGSLKLWVATDFPNAAALKERMHKLAPEAQSSSTALSPYDLPGLVVKTELTKPGLHKTTTLVSVKEAPIANSEFTIPSDLAVFEIIGDTSFVK